MKEIGKTENAPKQKWIDFVREEAEKGNSYYQYELGVCFFRGRDVEHNHKLAVKWFGKAAENGYAKAQCFLGICYMFGLDVEQNVNKALELYNISAENGCHEALYSLGVIYHDGCYVEKDLERAIARELKKYNADFAYVYENRDKII